MAVTQGRRGPADRCIHLLHVRGSGRRAAEVRRLQAARESHHHHQHHPTHPRRSGHRQS